MLQFTWHEDKHAANVKNHKVSFLRAALIFENEIVEMIDDREDYGELRYVALGHVQTTVYRVVYTDRTTERFTSSAHRRPTSMTKKPTTVRYTLTEIKQQIAQGKDKTRADAPEGPKEDSKFWNRARVVVPPGKTSVHLRVDSDVLEWFKKQGDGHLTRMNAVLRSYVDAHAASVIAGKKRQRARRQKVPNKRPSRKWALRWRWANSSREHLQTNPRSQSWKPVPDYRRTRLARSSQTLYLTHTGKSLNLSESCP